MQILRVWFSAKNTYATFILSPTNNTNRAENGDLGKQPAKNVKLVDLLIFFYIIFISKNKNISYHGTLNSSSMFHLKKKEKTIMSYSNCSKLP